jgi:hypothetical protein
MTVFVIILSIIYVIVLVIMGIIVPIATLYYAHKAAKR